MDPTRLRLEVARAKQAEAAAFGEAQKAFKAKAKELSREHDDDVRRLKEVHLRELAAKETQGKSEAALRDLTEEFHHSVGTLQIIKDQLEERKHGAHLTREAQLDARERQIKEQQRTAHAAEARNEKKVAELRGLLDSLQEIQRNMRSESFADKERLSSEAERLRSETAARGKLHEAREVGFAEERKALNEVSAAVGQ